MANDILPLYGASDSDIKRGQSIIQGQEERGVVTIWLVHPTDGSSAIGNLFESFSFFTHYDNFCSTFTFTMVNPVIAIDVGWQVFADAGSYGRFFVGVIQKKSVSVTKSGLTLTCSGKDIGSKLVEGYINTAKDYNKKTPMSIIDELVGYTDYFTRPKTITSLSDLTGFTDPDDLTARNTAVQADANASKTLSEKPEHKTVPKKPSYETLSQFFASIEYSKEFQDLKPIANFKTSIGDTVFSKISELMEITGFEIFQEDSKIYIGDRNKIREKYRHSYSIDCWPIEDKMAIYNNIISSDLTQDISNRYSTVQVTAQSEVSYGAGYVDDSKLATDSTAPVPKFFAQFMNVKDDTSGSIIGPAKSAVQIREQQRRDGYILTYVVHHHIAQSGYPWLVNRKVYVKDRILNIRGTFVIYGVAYKFNSSSGNTTEITLSIPKNNDLNI